MNRNTLPANLKARVMQAARAQSSPTRQAVTVDAALVLLTAAVAAVNVFLAAGGIGIGARPLPVVVTTALGRASIALAASWAAFGRGGSLLGRSKGWLAATAVATPLATAGWMLLAAPGFPPSAQSDWHCLLTATLIGLAPLTAFAVIHRRGQLSHPRATGAALGAAAGAWVDFFMVGHCPASDVAHRLLCHLGPTSLLMTLGVGLGSFVIRPQPRLALREASRSLMRMSGDWSQRG